MNLCQKCIYDNLDLLILHVERIKKFEQTGDMQYIYRNNLDKACFQHDATYANNKDLLNRT